MLALIAVILILCLLIGWMEYNNRIERSKFINALIAKNSEEMVNMDLSDKTKVEVNVPKKQEDLIPLDSLSDEEFMEKVVGEEK